MRCGSVRETERRAGLKPCYKSVTQWFSTGPRLLEGATCGVVRRADYQVLCTTWCGEYSGMGRLELAPRAQAQQRKCRFSASEKPSFDSHDQVLQEEARAEGSKGGRENAGDGTPHAGCPRKAAGHEPGGPARPARRAADRQGRIGRQLRRAEAPSRRVRRRKASQRDQPQAARLRSQLGSGGSPQCNCPRRRPPQLRRVYGGPGH